MDINTGIPAEQRKVIADGLSHVLADSYTLYLKTHNIHWNVTGPMFQAFLSPRCSLASSSDDFSA